MLISESYKIKLQRLAGLLNEVTDQDRNAAFAKSNERVPFSKDMIITAIKEGREMGILFKADNDKYAGKVAKYRIIYPVAMGLSKKGNLVVRAFHKMGQSEIEAIKTGKRSAEVENTWRLFKAKNIKSIWFTENFFRGPLEGFNQGGDNSMINIEIKANFPAIIKYQDDFIKKMKSKQDQDKKRKNIVQLFKQGEQQTNNQPQQNIQNNPLPLKGNKPPKV